jgi:hypothetical protein
MRQTRGIGIAVHDRGKPQAPLNNVRSAARFCRTLSSMSLNSARARFDQTERAGAVWRPGGMTSSRVTYRIELLSVIVGHQFAGVPIPAHLLASRRPRADRPRKLLIFVVEVCSH